MPAPVRIELTDAARAELVTRFNVTRDAGARLRYQMVLLAAAGRTAPQIAPLVQRSAVAVWRVLKRYLAGAGIAGHVEAGDQLGAGRVGQLDAHAGRHGTPLPRTEVVP